MKTSHVLIAVAVICATLPLSCCLLSAVLGPVRPPAKPAADVGAPAPSAPAAGSSPPEPAKSPADEATLAYRLLAREEGPRSKLVLNVEVTPAPPESLPSEDQLRAVARELYHSEKRRNHTWVFFHLPGVAYETSAYASAHEEPENVRMLAVPKRWLLKVGLPADPPTRYATVREAVERSGDHFGAGSVEVDERPSPRVRLRVPVEAGDSLATAEERLKRAAVGAVLRAFIHTPHDRVTVTAEPDPQDRSTARPRPMTLSLTRAAALAAIGDEKVSAFDDLVGVRDGETYWKDSYSDLGDTRLFNDQGSPTLDRTFGRLLAASPPTEEPEARPDREVKRDVRPRPSRDASGGAGAGPDAKLRLALILLESGKTSAARERLREIVAEHPDTEAARKAAAELERLGGPPALR